MAKKSDKFPPVLIVSGSEDLLRLRFLAEIKTKQAEAGWTIEDVDGDNPSAILDVLDGGGLFSTAQTLAVVNNPHKMDLDLLERHHAATDYVTTLLLNIEGEPDGRTKFGKWVKKQERIYKAFPKPTDWKAPQVAADFVQEEAKRYGKTISRALATALVERVGSDLGILAFEIQKMAMLADEASSPIIDTPHVKGGMAVLAEAAVAPIADALAVRSAKKLSRAMALVRQTTKGDPTMRITRFLGAGVLKWMQAAHLDALPPAAAASELGMNPWYFENKILPAAKRWGKEGTHRLIRDLAAAERAVLNGAISPWTILTARLLASCAGDKEAPKKPVVVQQTALTQPAPATLKVPTFISKTDEEAVVVPVDPKWVEVSRTFAETLITKRKGTWSGRGAVDKSDPFFSKVVEFAVEHWLRTEHGFPPIEIDVEIRDKDVGWQPDVPYPDGIRIHCKSTPRAYKFGYAGTLQWSDYDDRRTLAEVQSGCDDLFRGTEGAQWVEAPRLHPRWAAGPPAGSKNRLIITGKSNTNDYVVLGVVHQDEGVVRIYFLLKWGYLLERGLVERTFTQQFGKFADPKAGVYLHNVRFDAGLGDDYVDTTQGEAKVKG